MVTFGSELLAAAVAGTEAGEHPLRHVAELPARRGRQRPWPTWVEPDVLRAFTDRGISSPWAHQVQAAELAHAGRHVVISTGTASGKSLAYQMPILNTLATDPRARALYISPTKALGHDQLRAAYALTAAIPRLDDVAPTAYDGDSPAEVRRFARERSRWVFSNPDMVHLALLRNHARWAVFLRGLRFVVVDECHYYRGVFGSNVAMVLRRLLRLCARYSADPAATPTVIFASATTSAPGATATELIGQPVEEVTEDGSPQGARTVALWEPALRADLTGENGAPVRRSAGSEAARVMADLIAEGARTLTFVRSRRGAELTALATRARLENIAPQLAETVASYRAGYLPEDRNALEQALLDGRLRGLATTNALELGIDIAGLDAVVLAGFPGTVTSFWQQAGRSGRRGQGALVVLVARDDPLDTYLVHHPAALLDKPIERVVIDPANPYILGPQLLCAATELPIDDAEMRTLGAVDVADGLVDDGLLRRRSGKYYPAPGVDPHPAVDIRGPSGGQVVIVEGETGRLLGTAGAGQAAASVHPGAVYLHQGESYVVDSLDFDEGMAFVHSRGSRIRHVRPRTHRHRGDRSGRTPGVRLGHPGPGAGQRDQSDRGLSATSTQRRGDRLRRTGYAAAHPGHHCGHVHHHARSAAPQRNRSAADPGVAACRRARRDRTAAAGGQLRSRRHRRIVHCGRPGIRWSAKRLRLRRLPGWSGIRRTGLPPGEYLAGRHHGRDRGVRMPVRMPVVRAIAEVRQRQRSVGQGGGCPGVALGVDRAG